MKKKLFFTTAITFSVLILFTFSACKDKKEEILIWNETNEPDTLYQNPTFEPDLADPTWIRSSDGWVYAYGTENAWEIGT